MELGGLAAGWAGGSGAVLHATLCLGVGWVGLFASVLHLGRPLHAYRALIGVRHSWLSREVLAFAFFSMFATLYVALVVLSPSWFHAAWTARATLLALVAATGSVGVACSVMVYHVVRRPFWRAEYSSIKFAGTAVVLGLGAALAAQSMAMPSHANGDRWPASSWTLIVPAVCVIAASSAKLWIEARLARELARSEMDELQETGLLLVGPLQRPAGLRRSLGVVGGVVLPAAIVMGTAAANPRMTALAAVLALAASIAGEMAERYLFFTGVVKPRMPRGLMP